mgnify:CR=1 FL=1
MLPQYTNSYSNIKIGHTKTQNINQTSFHITHTPSVLSCCNCVLQILLGPSTFWSICVQREGHNLRTPSWHRAGILLPSFCFVSVSADACVCKCSWSYKWSVGPCLCLHISGYCRYRSLSGSFLI